MRSFYVMTGIVACLAGLLLSGCAGARQKYIEKRYFVVRADRPDGKAASAGKRILQVRKFRVSPGFDGRNFVYRRDEYGYKTDFYNRFLVAPDELLTEQTRLWLRRSGLFGHVVSPDSHMLADYIVEGAINSLYGDFREGRPPGAVIKVQFFLIDDGPAKAGVILDRQYQQTVDLDSDTPESLIRGWNRALEGILSRFEQDLKTALVSAGQQ